MPSGKDADLVAIGSLSLAGETIAVNAPVHVVGAGRSAESGRPEVAESHVVGPAAFGTRAVPGAKRGGFVEKEEFGVTMRCHHLALAPAELQNARNPAPNLPGLDDAAVVVVQNSAIPH